jgi:hypothetical protein
VFNDFDKFSNRSFKILKCMGCTCVRTFVSLVPGAGPDCMYKLN